MYNIVLSYHYNVSTPAIHNIALHGILEVTEVDTLDNKDRSGCFVFI